ncbi:hypothetical protein SNEBB_004425 [Seison nebaliae]|nr:hypothetical protein SNEBB_004425 [Seison nebaliae]
MKRGIHIVRCPKCQQPVYHAEEVLAAGRKWHKFCFACSFCRKLLESTTVAEHEGRLYCKTCYSREFGPQGYGAGYTWLQSNSENTCFQPSSYPPLPPKKYMVTIANPSDNPQAQPTPPKPRKSETSEYYPAGMGPMQYGAERSAPNRAIPVNQSTADSHNNQYGSPQQQQQQTEQQPATSYEVSDF